jgi:hypothetical protein
MSTSDFSEACGDGISSAMKDDVEEIEREDSPSNSSYTIETRSSNVVAAVSTNVAAYKHFAPRIDPILYQAEVPAFRDLPRESMDAFNEEGMHP